MDKEQIQQRIGEIHAIKYWHYRGSIPKPQAEIDALDDEQGRLENDLLVAPNELTKFGNIITRHYTANDCGEYTQHKRLRGYFEEYCDAYTALLSNEKKLKIINYCEHDVSIISCDNTDKFNQELQSHKEWFAENNA